MDLAAVTVVIGLLQEAVASQRVIITLEKVRKVVVVVAAEERQRG